MKLFHVELDNLITSNRARGFEIEGNDFLLLPDRLIPEPRISGRLTSIRVEGDRIVESLRDAASARAPDNVAKNYMYYRGGVSEVRQADDDRHGPAAHRRGSAGSVRVLAGAVRRCNSAAGLFQEPAEWRTAHVHAGPRPGGQGRTAPMLLC